MGISSVTSEALQLKIRQLLPSQQGFGTDLSASNTIVPIIDLTASAEGSDVRQDLQTALAFGRQTSYLVNNGTTTIANTVGFWSVTGVVTLIGTNQFSKVELNDGAAQKIIAAWTTDPAVAASTTYFPTDYLVFLATGESLQIVADTSHYFNVSVRQIADGNGTLVQPSGFNPQ